MRMIPWAALPVCDHDGRFRAAPKTDLPVCRACITQAVLVGDGTADAVQRRQAVSTSSRPNSRSSSCPCIALTPPLVTHMRRARVIRTYPVGIARERRARTGRRRATCAARTAPSCTQIGPQMQSPQMHSHDSFWHYPTRKIGKIRQNRTRLAIINILASQQRQAHVAGGRIAPSGRGQGAYAAADGPNQRAGTPRLTT